MPRFLICLLLFTLAGCHGLNPSVGSYGEVQVFQHRNGDDTVLAPLREALEVEFTTFQQETLFYLYEREMNRLEDFQNRKNLLFLVDVSQDGPVLRTAARLLGRNALNDVARKQKPQVLFLDNAFSQNQSTGFLIAPTGPGLVRAVTEKGDFIRNGFLNSSKRRILQLLTYRGENKTLPRRIWDEHNWYIRMPAPFEEDYANLENGFFSMQMDRPGRLLFVHWQDGVTALPSGEELLALRDSLGFQYYDEDVVELSRSKFMPARFQGRDAVRLEGVWQNEKYIIGGPFRSLAFLDEERDRFFLIDYAVYVPGGTKKYYLWELESVVETFRLDSFPADPS